LDGIAKFDYSLKTRLENVYTSTEKRHAATPLMKVALEEILRMRDSCAKEKFNFFCEHIPALDTSSRESGIFSLKLPTTGDMYRFLVGLGKKEFYFNDLTTFFNSFPAVDRNFLQLVENEWNKGRIFEGTYFHPFWQNVTSQPPLISGFMRAVPANRFVLHYFLNEELDTNLSEVMTCE
jgi:hypothetical protein